MISLDYTKLFLSAQSSADLYGFISNSPIISSVYRLLHISGSLSKKSNAYGLWRLISSLKPLSFYPLTISQWALVCFRFLDSIDCSSLSDEKKCFGQLYRILIIVSSWQVWIISSIKSIGFSSCSRLVGILRAIISRFLFCLHISITYYQIFSSSYGIFFINSQHCSWF